MTPLLTFEYGLAVAGAVVVVRVALMLATFLEAFVFALSKLKEGKPK